MESKHLRITDREKQIIEAISHGFNSREISSKLNISPSTVDTHRKNAMQKLDARNTPNLIRLSLEFGIIEVKILKQTA
jgi:DNA-binding CsgD family transcriptional regulator